MKIDGNQVKIILNEGIFSEELRRHKCKNIVVAINK